MRFQFLFLLITHCYCVIYIQLNTTFQWEALQDVAYNNTYILQNSKQEQYYINVTLEIEDPDFYLIATFKQPYNPSNNSVISYFDWISQLENRQTRFIKLEGQGENIYISTTGKISQQYKIQVIMSKDNLCPNDCSNNGVCQVSKYFNNQSNGCVCQPSYVGNDCHLPAKQIFVNQDNELLMLAADQLNYFYVSAEEQKNLSSLEFQFETENQTILLIQRTDVLFSSSNIDYQNQSYDIFSQTLIEPNNPIITSISIDQANLKPLILVAQSQGQSSTLKINTIKYDSGTPGLSQNDILIIETVVPSVGGLIISIIVAVIFYRKWKNKPQKGRPDNLVPPNR